MNYFKQRNNYFYNATASLKDDANTYFHNNRFENASAYLELNNILPSFSALSFHSISSSFSSSSSPLMEDSEK